MKRTCFPVKYAWDVMNYIRGALGVRGTKLPRDFHGTFLVYGVKVVVYPSGFAPTSPGCIGTYHHSSHRIYVDAGNGRMVPAGRLQQVKL